MLFDASIVAASTQPKNNDVADSSAISKADQAATSASSHDVPAGDATVKPAESAAVKDPQQAAQKNHADTPAANDKASQADGGPQTSGAPVDSVLFVDPRVSGWKALADSVSSNTKVVVIDPTLDGITQVTKALDGMHGIKEVDFLTYGQAGQIELGASTVTDATLHARAQDIAGWRDSLTDNAQIQFWGCDVGAGTVGAAFVNDLHALTGVGVAASTDATGLTTLGGDWALERTAGTVDPTMPFSATAIAAYDAVLDAPTAVVTLSGPTDVLLGSSFTQTLTFDNTATNGVGYGPFIQLFVPTAEGTAAVADYRATLTSATYLGVNVSVQTIVLSDQIAGHIGTVGAINPLLLDASGQPTFVAAPSGFQVGDTMYVLTLPFGSFTATQPKAEVTLNFNLDSRSELTNSGDLKMVAIGGYQYGANALNDPGTDAPIVGSSVTSSQNVKLLNVTTAVSTEPGEGETATGSSHPGRYVITLAPAPAVSGQPINNLAFTIQLPNNVQYTGGTIAISGGGVAEVTPSTSGPGGTLTVRYASLSATQTIDIPIFVPQTAVGGGQIIAPGTGDPQQVSLNPTYTYTANNWTPAANSFDSGAKAVSGSGNGVDPTFTAKSLAVQVSSAIHAEDPTAATGFSPGDIIKYTIKFQVSDYFDLSQLKLEDILGDGMTLLPGMSPVLDVVRNGASIGSINFGAIADGMTTDNGQTVATTGTAAFWNYIARNANGQTVINFDVGGLLGAQPGGDGVLQGTANGTEGTVTFYAQVLDRYTDINGGASLRESDQTTNTVTGSGKVTSHVPGSTAVDESDTSGVTNQVVNGNLKMEITKVGSTTINPGDPVKVQAGELVTYTVTYDLTQGDYGNLDLKAFLPLPVYNLTTMTSGNGTDVNTFTVLSDPSGVTPTATVDTVGNAISFNFGTYDSTTNASSQKVTVQFTVRASDQPFADGLALTSQAQASYTSASGTNVSDTAIRQQTMLEPSLITKTGVVSLVGNTGTTEGGAAYAGDGTGNANPTTVFQPSGNGNVFIGTIPSTITGNDVLNQNVSGADGRDSVRVVQTVENTGHGVAYDVIVRGTLPSGYSATDVTNLKVTRGDGTVLAFTGTTAQFFSATGIQIHGGDGTQNSVVLQGTGDAANNDILYVTYDLKLTDTQAVGTTLALAGSILNWSGANNGPGFVSGTTPVGGNASNITDGATVATNNASFTKVISSTDNPNTTGNNVVVGETITYTFTITLPEGQMDNVTFTDVLPQYLTDVVMGSVTLGSNVTADGTLTLNYNAGTRTVTASFGDITNANVDANGTVTFTVTAKVGNDGTVGNNSSIPNTGSLTWDTGQANGTATATERDPSVTESITVNDPDNVVHSGQLLTYTFTVSNGASPSAPAEDFFDTIVLPSGLAWVPGSLTLISSTGATNVVVNDVARTVSIERLAASGTATFTFQATVNNDLAANTSLQVNTTLSGTKYTSMPGNVTGERTYTTSATKTVSTGVFVPTLVIVNQSNGTDLTPATPAAPATTADVVPGELVRMRAYVEIPKGENSNVNIDIKLPAGLQYVGNALVALASANGSMSSSAIDPAGNTGAIQINSSAGGFNPATQTITAAMAAPTVVGNVATFALGTVQNNANSSVANYAIIEFTAVVQNTVANQAGTLLSAVAAVGAANSAGATATILEPNVTISKVVESINQATGEVKWKVTLTNNGNTTAYNVNLNDTLAGNQSTISGLTPAGTAADLLFSGDGTNTLLASMTLGVGASESFTYTTTVIDRTQSVADSAATVTYASLDDTNAFITAGEFYGASYDGDGIGTSGAVTGERNGAGGVNDYAASEAVGLGLVQGNVWNDIGSALNGQDLGPNSASDTRLQGVTLTGVWATGTSTTVTDINGAYSFLLPTNNVTTNVSAPLTTTSSSTGGGTETLVYSTNGTAGVLFKHTESGLVAGDALYSVTASGVTAITGVNFGYRLVNTAPVISTWGDNTPAGAVQYTIGGSAVGLSTGSTGVADTQLDSLVTNGIGDYGNTVLTLVRNGGANSGDVFSGAGNASTGLFFNGGNVVFNGVTVGTYTMTSGTLSVTFATGTDATSVRNVLNNVTYSFTGNTRTLDGGITINATLRDNNTQTGAIDGNRFQGTNGQMTSPAAQVRIEIAPASVGANFQEPNNAAASGSAVALVPNLTLVNDQYTQVVLTISGGYQNGEDVLSFANVGMGNIAGVWNPAAGTMTLTSAGGTATTANWQAALRAVTYHDTSDTPNTGTRTVTFSATATDTSVISGNLATVTVARANDSPVLADVNLTLPHQTEDNLIAPTGAVGFLASTLIGNGTGPSNVTDPDGPSTTPSIAGMAITTADTTQGSWWYSTDGGNNWSQFASSSLPAVSNANALHLVADGNTRIYFQPKTTDWNGTVPTALTIRAWDQYSPTTPIANGTLANIGSSGFGTGINTAASAYSSAIDTVSLTVDAVNDAPVATGTVTFPSVNEDTTPPGQTVSSLFTPSFDDTRDTVSGGSSANTLAGIAITANAATAAQGNWQYTTDGTTWVDVPRTGLGDTTALILPSTASLRFVPEPQWNGTPGGLTVRLIDGSNTSNNPVAFSASSDVSTNGNTTAISAATVPLTTTVVAVNDAPVVSGTATIPSTEDASTGATVASVLTQVSYSDGTDTIPSGSTGTPAAGLAITGNASTAAQGTWQYTTDGTTWVDIPRTGLSDTNAIVIPATASLRFVPAADWNGTPGALTARISDGTTGLPATGAQNLGAVGGTSQWSNDTITIGTVTAPVNDAPVATGSVTLTTPGDTVTSLFTPRFDDTRDTVAGGSSANSLAGIAIVGNAANPATQGTWQYSLDGITYQDVPTGVSNGSAVLLPDTAQIRFVGVPGFTGTPGGLTVRLIDSSSGPVTYSASTDVSTNGNTTPISADTVPVGTIVSGSVTGSFQEPNNGPAGDAAVSVNNTVVLDLNPAITYTSASFQITGGYQNGQDLLSFTGTAGTGDIAGVWNAATGTMTLTSAGGATPAQWQAALRAIQYYNSSDTPVTADRTVTMTINQSGIGAMALGTSTIAVVRADDSPVLADVNLTIPNQIEDNLGAPTGAVGFLASTLVGNGTGPSNVTDPDGPSTVPSLPGLAITTADTSQGNWWYSTDGGATWAEFASSSLTAVSNANALHLVADGNTRIYFQPKTADWNGTIPTALTIRAWDQYSPTTPIANGTLADIGSSGFGTGINTAASAYSSATDTVSLTVAPVNDAPVVSGTATIPSTEDASTGATVASVLTQVSYSDGIDTIPSGSTGTPAAGLAITGNASTAAQGTWQYTTDGTTWVDIPRTGLSDTNAIVIPATASLRFVPAADWNGTPGALTARISDGTTGLPATGAQNLGAVGGTSQWSNDTIAIGTVTAPVNDAPVATGTVTFPSVNEDTTPPGQTVSSLFTPSFDDTRDTVSGGSSANTLAGIAITANAATAAQGNWQYTTDGTTWVDVPRTGLGDTTALILPSTASLRFVPEPQWNGTPGGLTVRLIDGSNTSNNPVAFSASSDVSTNGDTTAISAATVPLTTTVVAVNDAPVVSGTATVPPSNEDTPSTTGTSISTLLGQGTVNYTDGTDTIPSGSTGTASAGIAITGNASTAAQGTWQYSTDGGTTWVDIPRTGLSDGNAIVLPNTATLRFAPNGDWNGTPGALTARVSDGDTGLPATGTQNLGAVGGTSQWSAGTIAIGTVTPPVNDAPVATGTVTFPSVNEDTTPPGQTVSSLFTPSFDDTRDTVSGGSSANTLAGIAITANAATAAQGNWQYTTDGTTWIDVPRTGLGDTTALILPSTASLRFVPEPQWNGTPGGLTVRLIDGSNTSNNPVAFSASSDVSTNGNTTAISAATVPLTTTVVAVNDAPVVSGTATIPSTEDASTGATVASVLTQVSYTDGTDTIPSGSTGTPAAGLAITGNASTAAQGTWQYTTDGTTWVDIPRTGLSDTNAIVIPATASLRFVPAADWNGTPGGLTARISDGTTGLPATGAQNLGAVGGTSQWSNDTIAIGTVTAPVNDAPVVSGSATLPPSNEDTPSPTGTSVGTLLGQGTINYTDGTDTVPGGSTGTPSVGIAITGNASTPAQGTWQYSTDGGTTWVNIPNTGLSDTNALVLPNTAAIRFEPAPNWNGTPGSLTARVSDGDTGLPPAGTGDISTSVGGTGQWSAGTISIGTTTPPVNDAPVVSGTATVPPSNEDTPSPTGTPVGTLLGQGTINYTDGTDTVPGGSTGTPSAGIAITGNASTPAQGTWQYSTDGGTTWVNIPNTGLSDTNAIVLPNMAAIRFEPAPNWNGTPGALTARVSDGDTGLPPTGAQNLGAVGGTSQWSDGTISIGTTTPPVNDAPVVSGSATLPPSNEDTPSPTGTPVGTLLGQGTINYTDGTDTVPGGSTGTPSVGIAITGNASTPAQGNWQYSTDGGTTWVDVPRTGLSDTNALVLPNTATLRFEPAPNWNGTPGSLTARVSDGAGGLPPAGTGDISTGIGGTGQWSAGTISIGTTTPPVNDAPVVSGTATVPPSNEDTPSPTGTPVNDLLGQGTVNYTDGTDTVPGGSTGTPAAGIAITGNASTPEQGTWQYTTDGGTTWVDIPRTGLGDNNAIVIPATAGVRFVPQPDWNGTPGSLTARISDGTGGLLPTGAGDISTGIGGTGQWSTGTISIGTTTPPVNDAPVATGGTKLPDVRQDTGNPPGASVKDLFKDNFDDSRDTVPGGSSAHDLAGIAITGNASNPTQGQWRYSLDGGSTWTGVSTSLGDGTAIILPSTAMLQFVPNNGFSGTPGALTVRLIDSSSGPVTFSASTDVTINGGTTPFSGSVVPLTTNVTSVPPTGPSVLPNVLPTSDYLSTMFDSYRRDIGGMPSDWLVGSNVYRTMLANQPGTAAVSTDVFYGTAPRQNLRYEAASISGGPIPPWLYFDPTMLTFAGTPPEGSEGSYDLRVVATDRHGRQATADVHIVVLREPKDILGLLRPTVVVDDVMRTPAAAPPPPPEAVTPPDAPPPAADPQRPEAPTGDSAIPASPSAPSGDGVQLQLPPSADPVNGQSIQGFGLSPQLREQTQAGRLARARALLDALAA
jgi:hypothetical protein